MCPHCAAVGRSATPKKGSCYSNPLKMTDKREWDWKLMDEKGVVCKDENWRQGGAEIVVHRNPVREILSYEAILCCIPPPSSIPTLPTNTMTEAWRYLPQLDTGVVESGATHLYIDPTSPHGPPNTSTPHICVDMATRNIERSSATASLPILQLAADFPNTGYIITSFTNTIVGDRPICNADHTVLFAKHDVTVFLPEVKPILTGWTEKEIIKLWCFDLRPSKELLMNQESKRTTISEYSACNLQSVEALVRYMHAASGFPVKSTWLRVIKIGNFETWPGLTY